MSVIFISDLQLNQDSESDYSSAEADGESNTIGPLMPYTGESKDIGLNIALEPLGGSMWSGGGRGEQTAADPHGVGSSGGLREEWMMTPGEKRPTGGATASCKCC